MLHGFTLAGPPCIYCNFCLNLHITQRVQTETMGVFLNKCMSRPILTRNGGKTDLKKSRETIKPCVRAGPDVVRPDEKFVANPVLHNAFIVCCFAKKL